MSKVRVYELARELNIESKVLVAKLKSQGIEVASHQSTLTPEQIIVAKKLAAGEDPAAESGASSQAPTQKVIRRRREAADEEAKKDAAPAEAEAPVTPSVIRRERPASVEGAASARPEPTLETLFKEPTPAKPGTEASSAATAPSSTHVRPSERQLAESQAPVAREAESRSAASAAGQVTSTYRSSGGATIVRRATPEETKQMTRSRQDEQEERRPSPPRPSYQRGGDERPSPSQGGGGYARPSYGSAGPRPSTVITPEVPLLDDEEARRREKKRVSDPAAESREREELARKAALLKTKRDHVSTRTLLSAIDGEDEVEETESEAPVRRTVYTPSSGRTKRDAKKRKTLKQTLVTTPRAAYRVVKMGAEITVGELAKQMSIKAGELIKKLMAQGVMASINQPVDFETVQIIAGDFGFEVQSNVVSADEILAKDAAADKDVEKTERPPIVTIMGHVDHGKTSILDAIRQAKVAEGEAGGITQHIGAYSVEHRGKSITFLDTPGHEAFSAMRARGADLTDIVILVVAADDGVMPQTIEAISHAKQANVPIIVAVNKMDKPGANLDRVYRELMEQGIQSEEWGGETQFVKVSALKRTGLDDLLESIILQSEILELRAANNVRARGAVVEAHLDKGRGPVATIVVQEGSLKVGDILVAGTVYGKVRAMNNHNGTRLTSAGPSTPVEVIGLADVPKAGDRVNAVEDEKTAREVVHVRQSQELSRSQVRSSAATLDQLLGKIQQAEVIEVPVILKADTQGSVEALSEAILKLGNEKVRNRIVHKAVGGVSESEISLALTANAIIVAFNVRAGRGLDDLAEKQGVVIKYFSVIYDVVDTLKSVMAGKLPPILKEVVVGHAEVRQTISVPKVGTIAGSAVTDGKISRHSQLRLIRDSVVIFGGKIGSLRRFKEDVREVSQGYECGIGIEGYNDIREGDVIEAYIIEEHAPVL